MDAHPAPFRPLRCRFPREAFGLLARRVASERDAARRERTVHLARVDGALRRWPCRPFPLLRGGCSAARQGWVRRGSGREPQEPPPPSHPPPLSHPPLAWQLDPPPSPMAAAVQPSAFRRRSWRSASRSAARRSQRRRCRSRNPAGDHHGAGRAASSDMAELRTETGGGGTRLSRRHGGPWGAFRPGWPGMVRLSRPSAAVAAAALAGAGVRP